MAATGIAVADETEGKVEVVKPIGFQEFVRWYIGVMKEHGYDPKTKKGGATTKQLVEAYPGEIKPASFSAKLSNIFKQAAKAKLRLPRPVRAAGGRASEAVDAEALARELNLEFLVDDETEEAGEE